MNKLDPTIEELLDLKKSFNEEDGYKGYQVWQVINARIESLGVRSDAAPPTPKTEVSKAMDVLADETVKQLEKDMYEGNPSTPEEPNTLEEILNKAWDLGFQCCKAVYVKGNKIDEREFREKATVEATQAIQNWALACVGDDEMFHEIDGSLTKPGKRSVFGIRNQLRAQIRGQITANMERE